MNQTKIVLITGGVRGLGKNMALSASRAGHDVIITYRKRAEADALVRELEGLGKKAAALPLELTDTQSYPAFVTALRSSLETTFGRTRLDALVNNAGIGVHAPYAETTEAQLDALYEVHLKAPFLFTQALLPVLADGGRIVNVSTGLARFSLPGYSAYAAMKGAIEVLTRYQAKELASRGITVNTVAPGATETDFTAAALANPAVRAHISQTVAMGRIGQPDDIGPLVALLLDDATHWMTAQRLEVSGGQNL